MRSDGLEVTPLMMGAEGSLFGVLSSPAVAARRVGVIVLNSGLLHHVGPFKLSVDLCTALGKSGFYSLRIDQSGKGESPARVGSNHAQSLLQDYDESLAELRDQGIEETILIGLCSGADDALRIAAARSSVRGLVLLDGYAGSTMKFRLKRLMQKLSVGPTVWHNRFRRWSKSLPGRRDGAVTPAIVMRNWMDDSEALATFKALLDRGGSVLAVFTGGQEYYNYVGQLADAIPGVSADADISELFFPEAEHTYTRAAHRIALEKEVADWMAQRFGDSCSDAG